MPAGRLMSDLEWDLEFDKIRQKQANPIEVRKPITFGGE